MIAMQTFIVIMAGLLCVAELCKAKPRLWFIALHALVIAMSVIIMIDWRAR